MSGKPTGHTERRCSHGVYPQTPAGRAAAGGVVSPSARISHYKIFDLFTAYSWEEAVSLVHKAVREGVDVNANILTVENLLHDAIEKHEQLMTKLSAEKKIIDELQTILSTLEYNPQSTFARNWHFIARKNALDEASKKYSENKQLAEATECIIKNLECCFSPIHVAARIGSTEIMQALLDNGADIGAIGLTVTKEQYEARLSHRGDVRGKRMKEPYEEVIRLLRCSKADCPEPDKIFDIDPSIMATPMLLACFHAQTSVIEWLLDHGAHLDEISAKYYRTRVGKSSDEPLLLLKWIVQHVNISGDDNHKNFIDAFKKLLPKDISLLPMRLIALIQENSELSEIIYKDDASNPHIEVMGSHFTLDAHD